MFDFVNYTYSGVLAVLSALFGLSYPLILSCIEKIDVKYHSTRLTARFLEEKVFAAFKYLLVTNLMMAVVFPFIMDGNNHSRYLIAVQCSAAVVLIYYAFRLFNKVMIYYDAGKLTEEIDMIPGGNIVCVPVGQWHTIRSLESGTIMFECKDGKYAPFAPEDILDVEE